MIPTTPWEIFFFMAALGTLIADILAYDRVKKLYAAMESEYDDRDALCDEIARLNKHIEELQAKIDPESDCACSYDEPGIVCMAHSPELMRLNDKIEGLEADLDSAVEVCFKRGATEWVRLNYPEHYKRFTETER